MVRRVWLEQAGTGLSLNKHSSDQLPFISPECGHIFCLVLQKQDEGLIE